MWSYPLKRQSHYAHSTGYRTGIGHRDTGLDIANRDGRVGPPMFDDVSKAILD